MIRVHKYTETIDYIKDWYSSPAKSSHAEFRDRKEVSVELHISGLDVAKAKELKQALDKLGISREVLE